MVAGVCGGLAQYFTLDPVIVRLVFILTAFMGGLGIFAYIVMALVVPAEGSPRTEPSGTIRDNVQEIKNTAEAVGKDITSTFNNNEKSDTNKQAIAVKAEERGHHGMFIFGAILLMGGIIALLTNFGPFHWAWWLSWDYLWPLVLIGAGLLIILVRRK
jgi:phage shock protein C